MLDLIAIPQLALYQPAPQTSTQFETQKKPIRHPTHQIEMNGKTYPCYIGEKGISTQKKEGDKMTPAGEFRIKMVLYRPDRIKAHELKTKLPIRAITPDDAWCDDPKHTKYNQPVKLPFSGSHEKLWMNVDYYDLIMVTDYNMNPTRPGKGSAIFIHIKDKETRGCLGLTRKDLLEIINQSDKSTRVKISPEGKIQFVNRKN